MNPKSRHLNTLILLRNIFRGLLLITLLFRLFIVDKLSYSWDVITYIILAVSLAGMIVFEILVYKRK